MKAFCYYIIFALTLSGLVCGNLYSQQQFDPPQHDLTKLSGSAKVEALNSLVEFYLKNELDKSFQYAEQAVDYAQKHNLKKELAESLCNLGLCSYLKNDLDNADKYLKKSLLIAEAENDSLIIARNHNNLGLILWRKGNFTAAFKHYLKANDIAEAINNIPESAKASNYIGLIQWKWGDFDSALESFLKSLENKILVNDSSEIAITLNNIAHIYLLTENFNASLNYSKQAYTIAENIDDRYVLGRALNNLGNAYMKLGNYVESEKFHLAAIAVKTKANDRTGLGYSYNDLGNLYIELKDGNRAIENYNKALSIRRSFSDFYGISDTYISLAKAYDFIGERDSALILLNKSVVISKKHNLKELLHRGYFWLSMINEKLNRLEPALYFYKNSAAMKDSILNKNIRDRIAELQIIYESETNKREIDHLKNEARLNDVKIQLEGIKNVLLIALVVILLFVIIFLFYRYQISKKFRKSLEEKNMEIESRSIELERANETKNKFLSIISHDLRSPFLGLLGTIDYTLDEFKTLSEEEKISNIYSLKNILHSLFQLIENLLGWARIQQKDIKYNPEIIDLYSKVETALKFYSANSDMKKIQLKNNVEKSSTVFADNNMLESIINNLVSNAIKFTNSGGTVGIQSKSNENYVEICICDSGVGMGEEEISKLFRIDTKYSKQGTAKESGTGFGLLLCKEMIELNGGKIRVESEIGKGSKFYFTLPVNKE